MPPRKRHKQTEDRRDPIVRFAESIERTNEAERAERARLKAERKEAARLAQLAAEHAEAVRVANIALERAIAAAKEARRTGKGTAEADATWRAAKARVIELETGERPGWGGS